ncbi:MAG: SDR family NAD(P)-dependent oxidoreductase [Deltaproteobacteria bacterium]|nr:SDR family NAD(P)-dependent oxidoreductase [Deltaproteobacteria bacterium]
MNLKGKVAIITGSSRGIGKQIALTLAKNGAKIAVVARTEKEGTSRLPGTIHQTVSEIRALGGTAIPVRTDLTVDADIENMAKRVLEEWGHIDILVNNAAANLNAFVVDLPVKYWDLMMRVNLRGTFLCTKAVLPAMIAQKSGSIICMTSIAAKRQAPPGEVCYSITKVGIEYFAWGLAQEVKQYNIAVNDLYPTGGVTTDGFKKVFAKHQFPEEMLKSMKSPEQIAEAALWLARQTAETFTGHSVNDDEVRALSQKTNHP